MQPLQLDTTIAAVASAAGSAARGIIRLTGPDVLQALPAVFTPDSASEPTNAAHRLTGVIHCDDDINVSGSAQIWPTSRSYTGQPMVELHLPGSPPLIESTLERIFKAGVRPATPGEFTLRAFLAGRIDLTQAEAVLGVIDANTSDELTTALQQLAGGLSGHIQQLRADLIDLLADLEAGLDFVEEDIEFVENSEVIRRLNITESAIDSIIDQSDSRMQSVGRPRVVLAGLPNAGKSTLFNALTNSGEAIVSHIAGTTRDYLSAPVRSGSTEFDLIDTAGWERGNSGIDSIAQQFRSEQIQRADLVLWCTAADAAPVDRSELGHPGDSQGILQILTRCDLSGPDVSKHSNELRVSSVTGAGLPELRDAIVRALSQDRTGSRQLISSTAARSRGSLQRARSATILATEAAEQLLGNELVSLEIREILESLGEVVGAVYTDDILDRIFSRFCIGK
jgi:tRNA modification GTPase